MHPIAQIAGPPDPLASLLLLAVTEGTAARADVFLALDALAEPECTIGQAETFAAACRPDTSVILMVRAGAGWPAAKRMACIAAFTRHAALAWTPRRIRVNAIALGVPAPADWNATAPAAGGVAAAAATPDDVARVALALLRLPSMTGQVIRLAA